MLNVNKIKLTRKRTGPIKKWSTEEEIRILHYVNDGQNQGKLLEKPSAPMYYDRMISKLKLNASAKQIKAKVQNCKTRYLIVTKWLAETGQGVDSGTIEGYKASKCPQYDLLHAIFKHKANVSIPYKYGSLEEVIAESFDTEGTLYDAQMRDIQNAPDETSNEVSFSEVNPFSGEELETEIGINQEDISLELGACIGQTGNETEALVVNESRLARFKKQLSEKSPDQLKKKKTPSNAAAFISDANIKRAEAMELRNDIELSRIENEKSNISINKDRFELEKVLQDDHMNLSKKELDLKEQEFILKQKEQDEKFSMRKLKYELNCKKLDSKEKKREDDYKLKVLEMEKNERLEKIKIEYEFKLQVELAKLKHQV